jgi:hypothetical protein
VSAGFNTGGELTDADIQLLSRWLNPAYLKSDNWSKVAAAMDADGSVQLKQFLKPQLAAAIAAAAKTQDAAEGVGGGKIPDFKAGYGPGAFRASAWARCVPGSGYGPGAFEGQGQLNCCK